MNFSTLKIQRLKNKIMKLFRSKYLIQSVIARNDATNRNFVETESLVPKCVVSTNKLKQ